ncbi:CPBP family intramembrane glutamic endopeptidase [Cytobacillus sp. Hm23]
MKHIIAIVKLYLPLLFVPIFMLNYMIEDKPIKYFYLLLAIWFLYNFVNEKANFKNTYEKTENLVLGLLDILMYLIPIIATLCVFFFPEVNFFLLLIFLLVICFDLFFKLTKKKLSRKQDNSMAKKGEGGSNTNFLLPALLAACLNLVVALFIINIWLTPQIYIASPFSLKVLLYGVAGAFIPLIFIYLGVKIDLITIPLNKYTEGLIRLTKERWGPLFIALSAGISEELLFRGAIFELLLLYLDATTSILLISIIFTLLHIPQYKNNVIYNIVVFALSIVFTVIYLWTENIWAPILAHAIYNYFVSKWIHSGFIKITNDM